MLSKLLLIFGSGVYKDLSVLHKHPLSYFEELSKLSVQSLLLDCSNQSWADKLVSQIHQY